MVLKIDVSPIILKLEAIILDAVKTPVKFKKEVVINQTEPVSSKKQELIDAIQFLKNKTTKTKVDKDKIQMLEVILKSV